MARKAPPPPYAELHAASAFSFLDGASLPEDLVERAAALELPAVALVDANGVYAAPRFYRAARQAGIKPLVGAEVALLEDQSDKPDEDSRLTLLVASRAGYRNLCRLLTAAARGRSKGEARASWDLLAEHAAGLHCLTGGEEGPLARVLTTEGIDAARRLLERLAEPVPRPTPRRAPASPAARGGAPQPGSRRSRPPAPAPPRSPPMACATPGRRTSRSTTC